MTILVAVIVACTVVQAACAVSVFLSMSRILRRRRSTELWPPDKVKR